ncbi:MAG: hypothetical protein WA162_00755 [Thermodesulfobacteriota bacterium]
MPIKIDDSVSHYVCVFHADNNNKKNVEDLGKDPDFSKPPTWGICRPKVRAQWVSRGSCVVFIGKKVEKEGEKYILKGWLRVGEKISYLEALERFPKKRNVIIRQKNNTTTRNKIDEWKRSEIKNRVREKYYYKIPDFLTKIKVGRKVFIQNPKDGHELDNWKCQRMFLCQKERLEECIEKDRCIQEENFSNLKGYIVANKRCDVGKKNIEWEAVRPASWKDKSLKHGNWHNPQKITPEELEELFGNIKKYEQTN